jgi:hypothetical protein
VGVTAIVRIMTLSMTLRPGEAVGWRFWEVETPRFVQVQGPGWLRLDEKTGALGGVPDAEGAADLVVKVTLERTVRKLDDSRLSWGHELVKEVGTEAVGSVTHRFRIAVRR